jgi:hypothetical protein
MIPPDHEMSFVYHDGSADVLFGGDGSDWYFSVKNVLIDWTSDEVVDGEWNTRAPIRDAKKKQR